MGRIASRSPEICVLALCAGCGRVDFDAGSAVCAMWNPPQRLAVSDAAANDYAPAISPDDRTLYFTSGRGGSEIVLTATRADRGSPFGTPHSEPPFDTLSFSTDVTITADDREMFFTATGTAATNCIFTVTRPTPTAAWGTIGEQTQLCPIGVAGPSISADGLELFYNTEDVGFRGTVLVTRRASRADAFQPGSPVPALEGGPEAGFVSISRDDRALYFEIGTPAHIWRATRADPTGDFDMLDEMTALDSTAVDGDPAISNDGRDIYFASDRNSAGAGDIFVASCAAL
jgi:hypothetical protein